MPTYADRRSLLEAGLGVAMVVAQQQLQVERTWAIAVVAGAVAGTAYALIGLVGRLATPWAAGGR